MSAPDDDFAPSGCCHAPRPSFPSYALDDALLARAEDSRSPQVSVYVPPQLMVVLGRGSIAEREIDLAACQADGVPVYRRRGGGCSVVLDPGNVIVSTAIPMAAMVDVGRVLRALSDWLRAGLHELGYAHLQRAGISDLALAGNKVSGSCLYRNKTLVYFSATLLVDADTAALSRYLVHPPREPDYRAGRDHASFVGRLVDGRYPSARQLAPALGAVLGVPSTAGWAGVCQSGGASRR